MHLLLIDFQSDQFRRMVYDALSQVHTVSCFESYETSEPLPVFDRDALVHLHRRAWAERSSPELRGTGTPASSLDAWTEQSWRLTLDRVFLRPISESDASLYTARLIELLDRRLGEMHPDAAVFHVTPHLPWTLLLQNLLVQRNVPTFAPRATQFNEILVLQRLPVTPYSNCFVAMPDLEQARERFASAPNDLSKSNRLKAAIEKNSGSFNFPASTTALFALRRSTSTVFRSLHKSTEERERLRKFNIAFAHYTRSELFFLKVQSVLLTLSRLRRLKKVSKTPPVGPYVLLMLQYLPEQNSDPESGVWRFPEVLIKHLRSLLHDEGLGSVPIVVREHPRQVNPMSSDIRTVNARSREIYERIAELRGVQWSKPGVAEGDLISSADLVVSANGTGPWIAANRGVPGLTMANTWYSECPACPSIYTLHKSGRTLTDLLAMSEIEVRQAADQLVESNPYFFNGSTGKQALSEIVRDSPVHSERLAQYYAQDLISMIRTVVPFQQ